MSENSEGSKSSRYSRRDFLGIAVGLVAAAAVGTEARAEERLIDPTKPPSPTKRDPELFYRQYPIEVPIVKRVNNVHIRPVFLGFSEFETYLQRLLDEGGATRVNETLFATQPFYQETFGINVSFDPVEQSELFMAKKKFGEYDGKELFSEARSRGYNPEVRNGTMPVALFVGAIPPEQWSINPDRPLMRSQAQHHTGTGFILLHSDLLRNTVPGVDIGRNSSHAADAMNHELGHSLGFPHNEVDSNSIMSGKGEHFYNQKPSKGITPEDLTLRSQSRLYKAEDAVITCNF